MMRHLFDHFIARRKDCRDTVEVSCLYEYKIRAMALKVESAQNVDFETLHIETEEIDVPSYVQVV